MPIEPAKLLMPLHWWSRTQIEAHESIPLAEMTRVTDKSEREVAEIELTLRRRNVRLIEWIRWQLIVHGKVKRTNKKQEKVPDLEGKKDYLVKLGKDEFGDIVDLIDYYNNDYRIFLTSKTAKDNMEVFDLLKDLPNTDLHIHDSGFRTQGDKSKTVKYLPNGKIIIVVGAEPIGVVNYNGLSPVTVKFAEMPGQVYSEVAVDIYPEIDLSRIIVAG